MPARETTPRGQKCLKCGVIHARCLGHNRAGKACGLFPSKHQDVCTRHGAASPQALAGAKARELEEQTLAAARTAWAIAGEHPVEDPLEALAQLAGEIVAWKDFVRDQATQLDGILTYWVDRDYYGMDGEIQRSTAIEDARAIVTIYERAQDRCAKVLGLIVKLDIADRMTALRTSQANGIVDAVRQGLAMVDLEATIRQAALLAIADQLAKITEQPPPLPKELMT